LNRNYIPDQQQLVRISKLAGGGGGGGGGCCHP